MDDQNNDMPRPRRVLPSGIALPVAQAPERVESKAATEPPPQESPPPEHSPEPPPAAARPAPRVARRSRLDPPTEVVVMDIHMGFWSMVFFMVKWVMASIPAIVILIVLAFGAMAWLRVLLH